MNGAISRKAADEILEKLLLEPDYQHTGEDWKIGVILAQFALYELPDAQPEAKDCWGCNCPKVERYFPEQPERKKVEETND